MDPLLKKPEFEAKLDKLRAGVMKKLRGVVSKEVVSLLAATKKHATVVAHAAELQACAPPHVRLRPCCHWSSAMLPRMHTCMRSHSTTCRCWRETDAEPCAVRLV